MRLERAQQLVSHGPFFLICVCIIVAWAGSLPLFSDVKIWMGLIHTVSSVLSLLLLVLLENSGRRAEEAAQEKLNGVRAPGCREEWLSHHVAASDDAALVSLAEHEDSVSFLHAPISEGPVALDLPTV